MQLLLTPTTYLNPKLTPAFPAKPLVSGLPAAWSRINKNSTVTISGNTALVMQGILGEGFFQDVAATVAGGNTTQWEHTTTTLATDSNRTIAFGRYNKNTNLTTNNIRPGVSDANGYTIDYAPGGTNVSVFFNNATQIGNFTLGSAAAVGDVWTDELDISGAPGAHTLSVYRNGSLVGTCTGQTLTGFTTAWIGTQSNEVLTANFNGNPAYSHSLGTGFSSYEQLFVSAVVGNQEIDPGLLTNSQTFFAEQLNLNVLPPLVTNTQTFFSEQLNLSIAAGLFTNTQSFPSEQLNLNVLPPLLTNTQIFYSEQLNENINPGLLTNIQSFFSEKLNLNILPSLLTNTQVFYNPTVTLGGILVPLLTNTQIFYGPTITISNPVEYVYPSLLVNKVGGSGSGAQFFSFDVRLSPADHTINDFSSGKPRYRRNY